MGEARLVVVPDRPKAGNPYNLLREPHLPRLPDQKEPEMLQDLSPVSFKSCRREEEGTILDCVYPEQKSFSNIVQRRSDLGCSDVVSALP